MFVFIIQNKENRDQRDKCPKRTSSVTKERQRNSDRRKKSHDHGDVDEIMNEKNRSDRITKKSGEFTSLGFGQIINSKYK